MSRSDPYDPKGRGGSCRGLQKHMYGGTSLSGGEKPLLVPLELASKPLTRIENRKLGWVLGASTDVRAWIMSCPRHRLACPGPVPDPRLMELELVTKVTWKRELGFSSGLVTG